MLAENRWGTMVLCVNGLRALQHKAFQVLAFWKIEQHRVVGRSAKTRFDARFHPGIDCRPRDDFLEQVGRHAARASENV